MHASPGTLLQRTHELLKERPRGMTIRDVAAGSGVAFTFVHELTLQRVKDPGVSKVQAVYEFLVGHKLKV